MSFGALDGSCVAAFVFGKLPAHGDFISRGLDDNTIEAADAALAEAVTIAALRWDHRWDDVYVETPVWRFVSAPGVLGRDWTAGVFMASVDAVGRQFPVVAGFNAPTLALVARGETLTSALDDAEALARAALIEVHSVDTLLASFEAAARRFDPPAGADPGQAFAAAALAEGQSSSWSQAGIFWVAGTSELEPVPVVGPWRGEALAALFQPAPIAEEPLASAPVEAEQAAADPEPGVSPPDESVVSSAPPADAA